MAVSRRLTHEVRDEILDVLLTMHRDPANRKYLDVGLVDHFVPVNAASYDDIRKMLKACEEAHFMTIR